MTYNFLHSGKLVPWWLGEFWNGLTPQHQHEFYVPRDTGLSPVLDALLEQQSGPMFYLDVARSFVDLNREDTDLKPGDVDGEWPFGPLRPWEHGAAKDFGLFSRRCDASGEPLYKGPIPLADAVQRVSDVYRPAWKAQDDVVAQGIAVCGELVLLSMHSYNTWSTAYMGGATGILRKEICVSDLNGLSSDPWVTTAYAEAFAEQGFQVGVNDPVSGAWALQRMVQPVEGGIALPPSDLYEAGLRLVAWRPDANRENPVLPQVPGAHRRIGVHALQIEHRKDLLEDPQATQRIVRALLNAEERMAQGFAKT